MKTSREKSYGSYKECPYCGQNKIPFKMGICICGQQVGNIKYIKNTENFAKNYYSYRGVIV